MSSMSKMGMIGKSVLGGFLMLSVAGGGNARAAEVENAATLLARADAAQQRADAARLRASELEEQKGWVYKSGLIEHANADAARYQAEADEARARAYGVPLEPAPVSPELQAAQDRVDELKFQAGWAYKGGSVERAENEVRVLEGQPAASVVVPESEIQSTEQQEKKEEAGKPVEKTTEPGH